MLKNVYKEMKGLHELKNGDLASMLEAEKYGKNLNDMEDMFSSNSSAEFIEN